MEKNSSRTRLLVGLCRSGSTMLQKSLSHAGGVTTSRGLINYGGISQVPDYSVLEGALETEGTFLVHRENIGGPTVNHCRPSLVRNMSDIERTKPVVLVRDPLQVYDSWKRQGWGNLAFFLIAHQSLIEFRESTGQNGLSVTYEELTTYPQVILEDILTHWGMPFDEEMIQRMIVWPQDFTAEDTVSALIERSHPSVEQIQQRFRANVRKGVHDTLLNGEQRIRSVERQTHLTKEEEKVIEESCMDAYEKIREEVRRRLPYPL